MKKIKYLLIYFPLFLFSSLTPTLLTAADLHAIIVTDTHAKYIERAVQSDLHNIHHELKRISTHTSLPLKETIFSGRNTNPHTIKKHLDSLSFEADDIVVFYFSGHGFRTASNGISPWPMLALKNYPSNPLHFYHTVHHLIQKQPKFLIAISDCCNNFVGGRPHFYKAEKKLYSIVDPLKIESNYRSLFLENNGAIVITGAEPGEFSYAIDSGGLLTLSILRSLEKEVKHTDNPNWLAILTRASMNVSYYQTPQIEIFESIQEAISSF